VADLDHLVFTVPNLDEGVALVEDLLGMRTSPGGRHVGLGTHNRLIGLGPDSYLEIVAVDPGQPAPAKPRWFGLDHLDSPRLATWCVKSDDLVTTVGVARLAGVELGAPVSGSRERPDGTRLSWTFTDPWADRAGGTIPFFIDWGGSRHPAEALPGGCRCVGLRVEHPDAAELAPRLSALGLDTSVSKGHAPRVVATLDTPNGIVELS